MSGVDPLRRVLVTRREGTWPTLAARFAGTGIALEFAPTTLQVEPLDPRPGDAALLRLAEFSWLVLTSGQGVKALTLKLAARDLSLPSGLSVATVGPATARALTALQVQPVLIADDARGDGLSRLLAPRLDSEDRVLIVRPEGVSHGLLAATLRATGAHVVEAALYRTIASEEAASLAEATISGRYEALAVTAPSGLSLWLAASGARRTALRDALRRARCVAIGPTTSAEFAAEGIPVSAVAETPDETAVGDAIIRALSDGASPPATMPPPRGGSS